MDRPEIVSAIRSSLFATRGMRRGYDVEAVDDLLDQVVASLHGRATQPSTQQGSALIAPRQGFLARLLGR